jgi:hypothetical protein
MPNAPPARRVAAKERLRDRVAQRADMVGADDLLAEVHALVGEVGSAWEHERTFCAQHLAKMDVLRRVEDDVGPELLRPAEHHDRRRYPEPFGQTQERREGEELAAREHGVALHPDPFGGAQGQERLDRADERMELHLVDGRPAAGHFPVTDLEQRERAVAGEEMRRDGTKQVERVAGVRPLRESSRLPREDRDGAKELRETENA